MWCVKRKQARIPRLFRAWQPSQWRRLLPPDRHLLLRLGLHRAAGLAAVGFAVGGPVHEWSVGAPLTRGVYGDGGAARGSVLGHLMRPQPCPAIDAGLRSEERSAGTECDRPGSNRRSPDHKYKNNTR